MNKINEGKTPEQLINNLKQKPTTTETIGVQRPIEGQLHKESQIDIFAKENKISKAQDEADKIEEGKKFMRNISDVIGD